MYIQNRKLIIISLIIANLALIALPWYFAALAIILALINLFKSWDFLFSSLIIATALISAIIGSIMPPISLNLQHLSQFAINIDNLEMALTIMLVPLGINLLFIAAFETPTAQTTNN